MTVGIWLVAGVALVAADFWEEQSFTEWSDKDVQKMLADSPWAQQVRIAVGNLSEDVLPTAAPVKQDLVRQATGLGAPVPA